MEEKIIKIANKVRKKAEKVAKKEGFRDNLCGLCARASSYLHRELYKEGIKSKLHIAVDPIDGYECHMFVSVNNKIIDVTATQFGFKEKVLVIPKNKKDKPYFHKIYKTIKNEIKLQEHQESVGWTWDQTGRIGKEL